MRERIKALRASVANVLARPYVIQTGIVLCSLVVGLSLGRLFLAGAAPEAPAVATDPASTPKPPASAVPVTKAAPGDWADSVALPDFITDPSAPGASRAYRPVGTGAAPVSGTVTPSSRPAAIDPATVRAVAVVRVSGETVAAFDVGLGPSREATPGTWRDWSLLGDCAASLRLAGPWPAGQGDIRGRLGEWLFSLAVPAGACTPFESRTASRRLPAAAVRQELTFAVQTDPGIRAQGAPAFRETDLREFAQSGDVAWGVFRTSVATTQVYPPPPRPQLAFVAKRRANGQWAIAWSHFSPTASQALGLAGATDLDGDGAFEAFFGLRHEDGAAELLHVAPFGNAWGLVRRIPLGRVIRR